MTETPETTNLEYSILSSTKKTLGISASYTVFDQDIIMHINSVFALLNQLGLGPDEGFFIIERTNNGSSNNQVSSGHCRSMVFG